MIETTTAVTPFDFHGNQIRTIRDDRGEPWFVAKDVARVLGYSATSLLQINNVIKHVPEQWKGHTPIMTPGGNQRVATLSEPGLYFFLNRSDTPHALPFQMWVAGTVLPSIRKTGGYIAGEETMNEDEFILRAMEVLQRKVEVLRSLVQDKQTTIDQQAPLVEEFEQFLDGDGGVSLTQALKVMGLPPNLAMAFLRKHGCIYDTAPNNSTPLQQHIESGYFFMKSGRNKSVVFSHTLVTPKGMSFLHRLFKKHDDQFTLFLSLNQKQRTSYNLRTAC